MRDKEIFEYLSAKFKLLPIIGKDVDGNYFCTFYEIRVLNRKFLFIKDTGYGLTKEEALKDLFEIYMNKKYLIRKKTNKGYIYFTTKIRKEIKKLRR